MKRTPKIIEEVCIYYRLRSVAEKLREQVSDAGFAPTPCMSESHSEDLVESGAANDQKDHDIKNQK